MVCENIFHIPVQKHLTMNLVRQQIQNMDRNRQKTLLSVRQQFEELIENLVLKSLKLTRHQYTTKQYARYKIFPKKTIIRTLKNFGRILRYLTHLYSKMPYEVSTGQTIKQIFMLSPFIPKINTCQIYLPL